MNNRYAVQSHPRSALPATQPRSQAFRRLANQNLAPRGRAFRQADSFDSTRSAGATANDGAHPPERTLVHQMTLHGMDVGQAIRADIIGSFVGGGVGFVAGCFHTAMLQAENATTALPPEAVQALLNACAWATDYVDSLPQTLEGGAELKALQLDFEDQERLLRSNKKTNAAYQKLLKTFLLASFRFSCGVQL